MSKERRGAPARLGIAALNIAMPGLGLLRTGNGRLAAILLAVPWFALGATFVWYAAGPELTFTSYAVTSLILLVALLGALAVSIVLSWRRSAERSPPVRWWSRWYGIAALWLALLVAGQPLILAMHGFYKPFYIPAESMMPTLAKDDRFIASMRGPGDLRRGDIVLVRVPGGVYVKRVAALPGDRFAMVGGAVLIDGSPVPQRLVRTERVDVPYPREARRLVERFPGEVGDHEIYDIGMTLADDFPEIRIPAGHLFVLGDNRDQSADSRIPREQQGLELVPTGDVVGRPLFFTWRPGRGITGERIAD
jgi:signal peptidase I